MQKLTRNSFEGGLNTDLPYTNLPPNQYYNSRNVTLTGDGQFTALQNIKGTVDLSNIVTSVNKLVLGVYANRYKINGVANLPCLTIFVYDIITFAFNIIAYDITNSTVYPLFTENTGSAGYTADLVIDAVLYAESGVDILYFTDNVHEIRKLRCQIDFPFVANSLTNFDISLQKNGALGYTQFDSILTGGSLLCGAYQFAYQMVSPAQNKYSRWSILCNPVMIYNTEGTTSVNALGGVGMYSSNKIRLDILTTAAELANYTHFRIGVIENIFQTLEEGQLTAYATPLEAVATYTTGTQLANWEYKTNAANTPGALKIPVSDLTVDLLAYQTVKTLTIKYNRLLAGNITYKDLPYNNGTPSITGGAIIRKTDTSGALSHNPFALQAFATQYVGHFRDEVYRYAISYFDEFGNFSSPVRINASLIPDNQTANGDMKYPSRSLNLGGVRYTLFDSSGAIQSLGLRMAGLDHHPTWAKGFVILRAKRKKNILWQSPFFPMMKVRGMGATLNYPTTASEGDPNVAVTHDTAQPMGPNTTYFPPNFFWPQPYRKIDITDTSSGAGATEKVTGEAFITVDNDSPPLWQVYPTPSIYGTTDPYVFNASDKLKAVDACQVSLYAKRFDTAGGTTGQKLGTSMSGTFYALADQKYYYDSGHSGVKPSLYLGTSIDISAYQDFPNFSVGGSVNGHDVLKYENIQTTNLSWSTSPDVMKTAVIAPTSSGNAISPYAVGVLTFATGTAVATSGGTGTDDTFVYTDSATHAQDLNIVAIMNCTKGLSDDRYGPATAQLEYIFTGTIVTFSAAQLVTVAAGGSLPQVVDIWGGDCITAPHTFKITNSVVTTTNQGKYYTVPVGDTIPQSIAKWRRAYNTASVVFNVPIALDGCAQYLEVVLESEHNGTAMDQSTLVNITSTNGIGVNGIKDTGIVRVPLNYNYNINYSKQNSDKVFVPRDVNIPMITSAPSRMIFSDTKIYQSNVPGFDTLRVLNFYDLDETYGGITKLAQAENNTYALQDRAVVYIPIGTKVLETADAGTLAVSSGDYINLPVYVSVRRGCQNRGAVVETGAKLYFPDTFNKAIYSLEGQTLTNISDLGMATTFRNLFDATNIKTYEERQLKGFYDPFRGEYWIYTNQFEGSYPGGPFQFCYTFNEKFNCWVSNHYFDRLYGAGAINENIYVVGKDTSATQIHAYEMYTGTDNLMGQISTGAVQFSVNPEMEAGKTFDDIVVSASNMPYTITGEGDFNGGATSATNGMSLENPAREGTYRIKVVRDSITGARMRGRYINWALLFSPTGPSWRQVAVSSIMTEYSISQRKP